ncbi:MAG: hypothetical protein IJ131_10335 [Eggerthellaceae bacterium]|nr:hypothetical protein [Eggerthellaceae bacterium]
MKLDAQQKRWIARIAAAVLAVAFVVFCILIQDPVAPENPIKTADASEITLESMTVSEAYDDIGEDLDIEDPNLSEDDQQEQDEESQPPEQQQEEQQSSSQQEQQSSSQPEEQSGSQPEQQEQSSSQTEEQPEQQQEQQQDRPKDPEQPEEQKTDLEPDTSSSSSSSNSSSSSSSSSSSQSSTPSSSGSSSSGSSQASSGGSSSSGSGSGSSGGSGGSSSSGGGSGGSNSSGGGGSSGDGTGRPTPKTITVNVVAGDKSEPATDRRMSNIDIKGSDLEAKVQNLVSEFRAEGYTDIDWGGWQDALKGTYGEAKSEYTITLSRPSSSSSSSDSQPASFHIETTLGHQGDRPVVYIGSSDDVGVGTLTGDELAFQAYIVDGQGRVVDDDSLELEVSALGRGTGLSPSGYTVLGKPLLGSTTYKVNLSEYVANYPTTNVRLRLIRTNSDGSKTVLEEIAIPITYRTQRANADHPDQGERFSSLSAWDDAGSLEFGKVYEIDNINHDFNVAFFNPDGSLVNSSNIEVKYTVRETGESNVLQRPGGEGSGSLHYTLPNIAVESGDQVTVDVEITAWTDDEMSSAYRAFTFVYNQVAEGDKRGTCTVVIDMTTVGLDRIAARTYVADNIDILQGDKAKDAVLKALNEFGLTPDDQFESSGYLKRIYGVSLRDLVIPPTLRFMLEKSGEYDSNLVGRHPVDSLGEKDYALGSGWTYYLEEEGGALYQNSSLGDKELVDGSVLVLYFTLAYGKDYGVASSEGGGRIHAYCGTWIDGIYQPYHSLQHVDKKDPTCNANGEAEHWECSVCGRKFYPGSDPNASNYESATTVEENNVMSENDLIIPSTGEHRWVVSGWGDDGRPIEKTCRDCRIFEDILPGDPLYEEPSESSDGDSA